ncbi:MAG TPA: hypothetical protein VK542_06945, partial [Gemmatimonadaceae bacterium]|nr:hypothetical protein [Gemmatimonadaceae bacterium]
MSIRSSLFPSHALRKHARFSATIGALSLLGFALAACAGSDRPTAPRAASADQTTVQAMADNPNSAAGDAKGVIHGWLNGETVSLRYTRMYFCAEPPTSAVSTHCEVGADATVAPRSGPIP